MLTPWRKSYDQTRQHTKEQRHYFADKRPSSQTEKWKSLSRIQLFATPWTIQSMEFSRQEYWSEWPFPLADILNAGVELGFPALQADSLPTKRSGKPPSNQSYGFSSSHVWMWELDHKESWVLKNWCFWTMVLEKTLESPLDCKEIKLVNPKVHQPWTFTERTDAEAETPKLWLPDAKNWLLGKDSDAGKGWR